MINCTNHCSQVLTNQEVTAADTRWEMQNSQLIIRKFSYLRKSFTPREWKFLSLNGTYLAKKLVATQTTKPWDPRDFFRTTHIWDWLHFLGMHEDSCRETLRKIHSEKYCKRLKLFLYSITTGFSVGDENF